MTRTLALCRLLRLPNVFTALADVSVGLLVVRHQLEPCAFLALLLTSACLYSAGMSWNDYFDRTIDARERPQRPIPSGAITAGFAFWLSTSLAIVGVLLAGLAGWQGNDWCPAPLIHSIILVALIVAYDAKWKSAMLGPWLMGGCRFANVLLGFSAASMSVAPWGMRLAAGSILAGYVIGITIFARNETGDSQPKRLSGGFRLMLTSVIAIAAVPALAPISTGSWAIYGAMGLSLLLLWRVRSVLQKPVPSRVQSFVKTAIMGIIVLDTCLALGLAGPIGIVVVIWLIPAMLIGRWVYST